jgi:hypothetical protein
MSYVVHLWEEAAPACLQDADRLHERLAAAPASANPKFAQLALALIDRFPTEVGGRGLAGASWVESPPDGRTDKRVYSVGLYAGGITELLPVLVEKATALGLTVYDDQAGRVYLPGGVVLDNEGQHRLSDAGPPSLAAAVTPKSVEAAFKAEVLPQLAAHGFRMVKDRNGLSFVRLAPVGEQLLSVWLQESGFGGVEITLTAAVRPNLPRPIAQAAAADDRFRVVFAVADLNVFDDFRYDVSRGPDPRHPKFAVSTLQALLRFLSAYTGFSLAHTLPLLDASRDAPGLFAVLRRPEGPSARFAPTYLALGLAHWMGVADFEALTEETVAQYEGRPSAQRVVRKLAQQLRDLPACFGIYPRTEPT